MDRKLANRLGVARISANIALKGFNKNDSIVLVTGKVDRLEIRCGKNVHILRDVLIVKDLALPMQILSSQLSDYCKNVTGIEIAPYKSVLDLLIGQNNGQLIVSREVIEIRNSGFMIPRCLLGLTLHGSNLVEPNFSSEFCTNISEVELENLRSLDDLMKEYFSFESIGCVECASLAHLICVPTAKGSSSNYKCPSCVLKNSAQERLASSPVNSIFSLPADLSGVPRRRIHSAGNLSPSSSIASLPLSGVSPNSSNTGSGSKRLASPPSPSVARDSKLHRCDTHTNELSEALCTSSADTSLESIDSQINMGSKNNDEAPPPYFAQFLERFDRRMDGVDNNIQQLDAKMSERVDRIEGQLMNIQQDALFKIMHSSIQLKF
ncbi:hypothetical protein QAD02_007151 [Eretmocerus hayati]|uniref:Uncharacterized protein n=1 Tax=Eretmocerus hayati TaxID=131215 RepID=A0ACC2N366_9HYME|nr:hypothetical protein QAD02_007151 [Eretmocerus hayati]